MIHPHRRALLVAALLAPAGAIAPAHAQQRPGAVQASDSGVVFDFQQADLRVVVSALADVAGLTIVYAGLPARTVTLRTGRPVSVSEVRHLLDGVASANGLELVQEGDLIRVVAREQPPTGAARAQQRAGAGPPGQRRLFVLPLRHARASEIAETVGGIFGLEGGDLESAAGEPGALSLSQELEAQRTSPLRAPERPQPAAPSPLPSSAPADTGRGITATLEAPVKIMPDELTNSLLVLATPNDFATIRAAIAQLDVRPLQVLIEVLIVEVRRDRTFNVGVNAGIPFESSGDSVSNFGLTAPSAGDVTLRLLNLGRVRANAVLRALAASGDVHILSRPILLAQNNQRARILVGDQRPFIQLFRALPTDAAIRDQVVQYRNVGTQLTIRPTINADGYVTLSVLQEVSNATSETQFGAPVINTREAETELMVENDHTAVLGGLVDRQRESSNSGIPLLKDIPLIGALFRSSQKRTTTSELFVLLTPHVLRTDADMDSAATRVRERTTMLRDLLPDSALFAPSRVPSDSVHPSAAMGGAAAVRDTSGARPDTALERRRTRRP